MSRTLRIYSRDFDDGTVRCHGGYQDSRYAAVKTIMLHEALSHAKNIGGSFAFGDDYEGIHVVAFKGVAAVGRYYFIADSPKQIPLALGWVWESENAFDDGDITCSFSHEEHRIGIRWAKTPPEVIEQNHGNDEFGGWYGPSIIVDKNESIALDCSDCDVDAVMLMMTNPYRIVSLGGVIALRPLGDD